MQFLIKTVMLGVVCDSLTILIFNLAVFIIILVRSTYNFIIRISDTRNILLLRLIELWLQLASPFDYISKTPSLFIEVMTVCIDLLLYCEWAPVEVDFLGVKGVVLLDTRFQIVW